MGRSWKLAAAAAALALTWGCTPSQLEGGPESAVRLDVPAAVGWEPGGPFNLELTIFNATGYRMMLVDPQKESLQVKVFRLSDGKLACKTPAPTHKQYEGWWAKPVRADSGLKFTVDVWPYCRNLGEGVYRYEAVFLANPASGVSNIVWTGTIGPQGGHVAVGPGLSTDEAALASVLARESAPPAAAPEAPAAEPSTLPAAPAGEAAAVASPEKPAGEAPAAATPAPAAAPAASKPQAPAKAPVAVSPEAIRSCIDRELAARGLNAYGDPQGTKYETPPVDEGGRVLYVASRNPDIRTACHIPGF